MNENQLKWLIDLQEKGIKFEVWSIVANKWICGSKNLRFSSVQDLYRIPAQSIPDIPDWREVCREMQSKGVRFKMLWGSMWNEDRHDFEKERDRYQILQQPIPEWREEMTKETKPDPREEIPHRELQIQWHEDKIHSLETGEPMQEWEYMEISKSGKDIGWYILGENPRWLDYHKYRRKPRTVTYWSCVALDDGVCSLLRSFESPEKVQELINERKKIFKDSKFGPIIETTVEVED